MTLQTELDAFRSGWESRVGETIAKLIAGDIEDLRGSGILARAAKAGDRLPVTTNLINQHGKAFDLESLVADKPVIITFYRGGWCPYCNLELRAYQALLKEIEAVGGTLVAVTPELPDHALSTAEKNDLAFTVLSDVGGDFAAALGIRFTLSDAVKPFYEKAGHALPDRNGDGTWALPMPATFVVDRGGAITAAFIEPDYRKRLDPQVALVALQSLRPARAA
ncbi:MAG: peroxiredoxin [Methylobacterium sp.]|nr:MAG: peroxiredoxin [Methylobacterium sp.]